MKEYRSDGLSSSQCHCEPVFLSGFFGEDEKLVGEDEKTGLLDFSWLIFWWHQFSSKQSGKN